MQVLPVQAARVPAPGYELNGVTRMSWGGKQETVHRVRLTRASRSTGQTGT
ncbi:hypothetical protein [Arthrobacter sp. NPDC057013]|uniref:hypothetical protein n=1 Tax=Arthrobacter sp. NPDC057013 TaxID=3345999 RepID=UPI00362FD2A3